MAESFIKAEFDSLEVCLEHIRENYPDDQKCSTEAWDMDSHERHKKFDAPAFLYRGEPDIYETTKSSIERFKDSDGSNLSDEGKERIECLTLAVNHILMQLFESANIHKLDSLAFLQHYGMPTQLIDFTSKLEVAACFASASMKSGLIGILPIPARLDSFIVSDLTEPLVGERQRKQSAYGVYSPGIIDLKSRNARDKMQIKWFSFKQSSKEIKNAQCKLLDLQGDKWAGIIRAILDSFPKQEDEVAKWLADHVAPPPFVLDVKSYHDSSNRQPRDVNFVPAGSAFDEDVERENNYRRWSIEYPDVLTRKDGKWRIGPLLSPMDFENLCVGYKIRRDTFKW